MYLHAFFIAVVVDDADRLITEFGVFEHFAYYHFARVASAVNEYGFRCLGGRAFAHIKIFVAPSENEPRKAYKKEGDEHVERHHRARESPLQEVNISYYDERAGDDGLENIDQIVDGSVPPDPVIKAHKVKSGDLYDRERCEKRIFAVLRRYLAAVEIKSYE